MSSLLELKDGHIFTLSRLLTRRSDLRQLAFKLGLAKQDIDSAIENNRTDHFEAAYELLSKWQKRQEDVGAACRILWRALTALTDEEVNLHQYPKDVLKVKPPKRAIQYSEEESKWKNIWIWKTVVHATQLVFCPCAY